MHYISHKGVANMNYSFDVRMKKFGTKFGKKQWLQKKPYVTMRYCEYISY